MIDVNLKMQEQPYLLLHLGNTAGWPAGPESEHLEWRPGDTVDVSTKWVG